MFVINCICGAALTCWGALTLLYVAKLLGLS